MNKRYLFNGYKGQLIFARACIYCRLWAQAEHHLKNAMGLANIQCKPALSHIMTALNLVRPMVRQ